jgi:hypothetical protein
MRQVYNGVAVSVELGGAAAGAVFGDVQETRDLRGYHRGARSAAMFADVPP